MVRDYTDILHLVEEKAFKHSLPADVRRGLVEQFDVSAGESSTLTVIEAAVPGCLPEKELLDAALDQSISLIQELQNMVAIVTKRPVRLISRATLQPTLPVVTGRLNGDGQPPTFEAIVPDFFIDYCALPESFSIAPEPLTKPQWQQMQELVSLQSPAFQLIAVMRREAMVQALFDGNTALGVSSAAAAGELLLNTALLHCTWEEGASPEEGAKPFAKKASISKSIGHLGQKLKGSGWRTDGDGPVAKFYAAVQVRNRVLHGGYWPTPGELEAAWTALGGLETFVGDSLCAPPTIKRYPRTALAWSGPDGIRRRGKYPYWIDLLRHDATEPNWPNTFQRWRTAVDQELGWQRREPGTVAADCVLYLRQVKPRQFECFAHDRGTGHVAVVPENEASDPVHLQSGKDFLRGLMALYWGERQIMLPWPESFSLAGREWVADYEYLEELRIHAGGQVWSRLKAGGF